MHNEKKEENNALFGFAIVAAAIGIVTLLYYVAKGLIWLYTSIFKAMMSPYAERDCDLFGVFVVLATQAIIVYAAFFMPAVMEKRMVLLFVGLFCYFAATAILMIEVPHEVPKEKNIRENLPWLGY